MLRKIYRLPHPCRTVRRAAFTLIEILLVTSILISIASVIVPELMNWMSRRELDHAAQAVANVLLDASAEAASTGESHCFEYIPNGHRYRVTRSKRNLQTPENVETAEWRSLPPGIHLIDYDVQTTLESASGTEGIRVAFDVSGLSRGRRLAVTDGQRVRELLVDALSALPLITDQ